MAGDALDYLADPKTLQLLAAASLLFGLHPPVRPHPSRERSAHDPPLTAHPPGDSAPEEASRGSGFGPEGGEGRGSVEAGAAVCRDLQPALALELYCLALAGSGWPAAVRSASQILALPDGQAQGPGGNLGALPNEPPGGSRRVLGGVARQACVLVAENVGLVKGLHPCLVLEASRVSYPLFCAFLSALAVELGVEDDQRGAVLPFFASFAYAEGALANIALAALSRAMP